MDVWQIDEEFPFKGSGVERTEGLHLTDILKKIEIDMGWEYKGLGFKNKWLTMEVGFMWESVLQPLKTLH